MEKKQKKEKPASNKRMQSELGQQLTQRLYASYSETQILIPNEVSITDDFLACGKYKKFSGKY